MPESAAVAADWSTKSTEPSVHSSETHSPADSTAAIHDDYCC